MVTRQKIIRATVFLITVFIVCIPLLSVGLPKGHSVYFHLLRIEGLKDGLLSGQFPVRINPLFFNGYGYGVPMFYPDVFLYLPAVLRIAGVGIEASCKIYIAVVSAALFISTYYCGKGITKSNNAALVAAVAFSLSHYFLSNIYIRFDIGELTSFVFLPFIVYGLYNFIHEDFDKPWLFLLGFIGLVFTHLISVVLSFLACCVITLFGFRRLTLKKLLALAVIMIATVGITCWFWLPLIEQYLTQSFNTDFTVLGSLRYTAADPAQMFSLTGGLTSIGFIFLFLLPLRILFIKIPMDKDKMRAIDWCLIIGFVLIFCSSKLFPWELFQPMLGNIQIPWRLYALASLFLSFAMGYITDNLKYHIKIGFVLIFVAASAVVNLQNTADFTRFPPEYYSEASNTYPPDGREYFPYLMSYKEYAQIESLTSSTEVLTDTGASLSYNKTGIMLTIDYKKSEYINIPLVYYKGYTAVYDGPNGAETLVIDGPRFRVNTSGLQDGTVIVDYEGTNLQKASLGISAVFIISFCMRYMVTLRSRRSVKSSKL